MSLRNLSVRAKLWTLVLIAGFMLVVLTSLSLLDMRDSLQAERKDQLHALLDATEGLLEAEQARVESGELSLEKAQAEARKMLETMRYNDNDYFFVLDSKARVVAHGASPELAGKSLKNRTTADGQAIFADMAALLGSGTDVAELRYRWPHPVTGEAETKITLAKPFEDWGWVVGTGVYVTDLNSAFRQDVIYMGALLAGALVILAALAIPIGRSITGPLERISDVMKQVAAGDLRIRTELNSKDELGKVGRRIDETLGTFQDLVHQIASSATQVSSSAEGLARSAEETSAALDAQAQEAELLSTAMNEMAASVHEVARSAGETSSAIEMADHEADEGNHDVDDTVHRIQALAQEVEQAAEVIQALEGDTVQIGQVLEEIQAISEQTNLLALNAAIEAARAGESGRGFAVVADEVRQLAQRTQGSTEEIRSMNDRLRSAAQKAVEVMDRSRQRADDSVQTAQHAGSELLRIVEQMARIRDMGVQVAAAAEEQSQVSEEMNSNLLRITQASESTVAAANSVASSGEELQQLSHALQEQINRFKT
ncbi:methyl-accepting chemotaxis protein [Marinobacterium sp. AK62]|uniref:Methyl-accepting chemotaxis protein n=1 Tax=Marinobacterium alkalitolerans TaxID=1542925 RepID=A0ABS3ZFG5_9GAMM|nr:methyl-accepting chemotaxis protein [Marinobacterium alkalitolerans]MBP0049784.1 methyl-accepting chemotaxis protein [Marinobacterium alkalitolerans]